MVDGVVLLEILRLGVRARFELIEHTLVAVMDLVAALTEPQAEVDVRVAASEGGVEAPDLLERLPSAEQAGAGHDLEAARPADRRMVGREAGVERVRGAVM